MKLRPRPHRTAQCLSSCGTGWETGVASPAIFPYQHPQCRRHDRHRRHPRGTHPGGLRTQDHDWRQSPGGHRERLLQRHQQTGGIIDFPSWFVGPISNYFLFHCQIREVCEMIAEDPKLQVSIYFTTAPVCPVSYSSGRVQRHRFLPGRPVPQGSGSEVTHLSSPLLCFTFTRCPNPPMKNLITFGAQHQVWIYIYHWPHCDISSRVSLASPTAPARWTTSVTLSGTSSTMALMLTLSRWEFCKF